MSRLHFCKTSAKVMCAIQIMSAISILKCNHEHNYKCNYKHDYKHYHKHDHEHNFKHDNKHNFNFDIIIFTLNVSCVTYDIKNNILINKDDIFQKISH